MITVNGNKHLSRFGVYNDTSNGWCFIGDDGQGFRGSLLTCEERTKEFRQEYPKNKYRVAIHDESCCMRTAGDCCEPKEFKP